VEKIIFETKQILRLDIFLQNQLPSKISEECSNSKIRRLIVAGAVSVNGRTVVRPSFELRGISKVIVNYDSEKFSYEKQPDDIQFQVTEKDVLYETDQLIFINKPAFFPVEQTIVGNRANLHDAVVDYLWKKNPSLRNPPYVGIMHRLDRETSGVILFTKCREINKTVSEMFQEHNFTKQYYAVVSQKEKINLKNNIKKEGHTFFLQKGQTFTVEMYMGRITGKSQKGQWGALDQKNGGQYSRTDFEVIQECVIENQKCLLIKCTLFTGRTHQIRVHLSSQGYPILGDVLYGGKSGEKLYLHARQLKKETGDLQFDVNAPVPW